MKHHSLWFSLLILSAGFALAPTPASAQQSCESLASLKIPDVTITLAKSIQPPPDFEVPSLPGRYGTPPGLKVSVPFCRVAGFAAPTGDSHIAFEVWLPLAASWNGKYVGQGNPGFVGAISYGGMAGTLARGYATASTDTGHADAEATGALPPWAVGHPEKVADWGHRAVHEMTIAAKQVIEAYYGKPPKLSLFSSCHEGGNQALAEAQKYPTDYDGIAAGDPAYDITHLQAVSVYLSWVALKDGVKAPGYIPPSKFPVIHRAVLDACDALDGVRDGLIENPMTCHFDPATIQCPGKTDEPSCLTAAQVETARQVYAGAKFADGSQIYPGLEPGSELDWHWMLSGPDPMAINKDFFATVVFQNPDWDWHTLDVSRDTRLADEKIGAMVNMTDPNLLAFKEHGGKLLMYQSWQEAAIPPGGLVDYYEHVVAAMGGPGKTEDFARLFVVPAAGMCSGFSLRSISGAWDAFDVIEKWRETNVAPEKIITTHRVDGVVDRTHPICPYPQAAIYKGSGDPFDAASFTCGVPHW
ncbi:MAG TPA: tannase/feruloyl esterase family alpha/beta hydrolase [Candidatus Aquilonibacter sp.]|nr:tannase/feruloyl esterase family alpha/beta hydrolase [Candidatus Aquilonibacter sp.]